MLLFSVNNLYNSSIICW